MKNKLWARAAALVMTICMAITMVPSVALAAEPEDGSSADHPLTVDADALVYCNIKGNDGIIGFSQEWYDTVSKNGSPVYVKLIVPAEIGGHAVKRIEYQSLQKQSNGAYNKSEYQSYKVVTGDLKNIKIVSVDFSQAKNLEAIGNYAFDARSELAGVIDLSNTKVTEIGAGAFRDTGITGVILPDGLTTLGDTSTGAGSFAQCEKLQYVRTTSTKDSEKAVVLPESLTTIGKQCFRYSFAQSVNMTVPASVTTVGAEAFNSDNIQQINVLHGGDFSGYNSAAFQNSASALVIFKSGEDYSKAKNVVYSDHRYRLTYELPVNFKYNDQTLVPQTKLYNQYLLYEKNKDGIWSQNMNYTLPSATDMPAGYEYDWKFDKNNESVTVDSEVNDGTTAPTSIDVVANNYRLTYVPNVSVEMPDGEYVHEDGAITLKGVISNKVDGLHYDMAWAIYNWTTGNWETLPNETSDTLTVTKGGTYNAPCCYLFVCEAYDSKEVRSEQGGDYVRVYSASHQWSYTAAGNTVTAACTQKNGTCPYAGRELKLTLTAPDAIANEEPYAGAKTANTITAATKATEGEIHYVGINGTDYTESTTSPTVAGTYKATVSIDGKTAAKEFRIYDAASTDTIYTVTLVTNDGTKIAPMAKTIGSKIAADEVTTTRAGYNFAGWYKDAGLTEAWDYETDTVTSNITLYAKWIQAGKIETAVTVDENTPNTTVSGLDALENVAQYKPADTDVVRIVLNVAAKNEDDIADDSAKIKALAGNETLSYLDMHIKHFINGTRQADITNTEPCVQAITVDYDTAGKNISVYRVHDGTATKLAVASGNPADGTYRVNDGSITIYATKFSTYAIGYTTRSSGSHGSGSSTTTTYPVEQPKSVSGGAVKADKSSAAKGATVTITVTPDKGYNLDKLTVTDKDGKTVALTSKGNGQYSFTMPAGKVTVAASFAETDWELSYRNCPKDETCPIWPFTDAETTAWYHDGVHFCLENGLMVGYGNNIFQPDTSTSRAMLSVMLWRLSGSPVVNYAMTFQDVAADSWYGEAVRWAASEGIVTGYDAQTFGPNNNVTREQMVTILYRYARNKGYDVSVGESTNLLSYADAASVAQYALSAMQWGCGSGMVQGTDNKLSPQGSTTRAQMATMMMRFCAEIVK